MSKETFDAMAAAIEAHVADESDGGFVSEFIVVAHSAHPERAMESQYHYSASADTPPHRLWGLVNMADRRARRQLDEE